jgi:hypothetical protein
MDSKKGLSKEDEDFQKNLESLLISKKAFRIEGAEPSRDLSFRWIEKNADLKAIEEGVPITSFGEDLKKRNVDMEFRVSFV